MNMLATLTANEAVESHHFLTDEKEYDEQGALINEFTVDSADPNSQYGILLKFREVSGKYL